MSNQRALSFKQLKDRLSMFNVSFSSPYTTTPGCFIGSDKEKSPGYPYPTGPICFVSNRPDSELIPAIMVEKILKHLEVSPEQFWAIQDYREETQSPAQT